MQLQTINYKQVAVSVWTYASKTLTSILNLMSLVSVQGTVIAASSTVDLRPTGALIRNVSIVFSAGAAGQAQLGLYNGSVFSVGLTISANGNNGQVMVGTSVLGPAAKNLDAANAASVSYSGWDWQ